MALPFDERMNILESALVDLSNEYSKLATADELSAVVEEIFEPIKDLTKRIIALRNQLGLIEQIIATAQEQLNEQKRT